jgi:hypothetical protein
MRPRNCQFANRRQDHLVDADRRDDCIAERSEHPRRQSARQHRNCCLKAQARRFKHDLADGAKGERKIRPVLRRLEPWKLWLTMRRF